MRMTLLQLILQGIPEQIGLVILAFVLARAELNWKRLCILGTVLACTAFFLRMLPITFGLHTIILICLLVFFVANYSNANSTTAIMSTLISFICLIVFEISIHATVFNIFQIPIENILNSQTLMILSGLPQVILLYLTSFLVWKYRKTV